MKRLICMLAIFISSPAWATFTKVQDVLSSSSCFGGATTCALTVSSTGSGNAAFISVISTSNTGKTISSVSAGCGSWAHGANTASSNAGNSSADADYCLSTTSGVTSITVTVNVSCATPCYVHFAEYSHTGAVTYDTSNNVNNTTNTVRTGVGLTLAGTNDLIYQIVAPSNAATTVSAINGAYTSSNQFGTKYGFAIALNTATGTAPAWTFNQNSQSAVSAVALQEATGGTTRRRAAVINN